MYDRNGKCHQGLAGRHSLNFFVASMVKLVKSWMVDVHHDSSVSGFTVV